MGRAARRSWANAPERYQRGARFSKKARSPSWASSEVATSQK